MHSQLELTLSVLVGIYGEPASHHQLLLPRPALLDCDTKFTATKAIHSLNKNRDGIRSKLRVGLGIPN